MESFIYKFYLKDISLCDELINYHKNNNEYKTPGTTQYGINKNIKESIDVPFHNTSNNQYIKKYFEYLTIGLLNYVDKYKIQGHLKTEYTSNIQYYPLGGGYKAWHYERAQTISDGLFICNRALVFMTYLNDVTDGGQTEWLYQKVKIKPKKGLTVIWPTDITHYHRGIPSQTQEKYIVTGWFNFI